MEYNLSNYSTNFVNFMHKTENNRYFETALFTFVYKLHIHIIFEADKDFRLLINLH